ncbi:MAG: glycosyltransferase [Candidatus Fermentibacteraceae bacterium]
MLVSVVLPFKNEARWLPDALKSLKRQTLERFEVVLVNDCSTDDSPGIVNECCRSDGRFRSVESEGAGLVSALNTGLEAARGEWVARLDADDFCHPQRLSLQLVLALALGPRCVVSCRVRCFPEKAVSAGYRGYEKWLNSLISHDRICRDIFVESPVAHPSAFFHRKAVIDEGGYRDLGLPEDYELWLRLWSMGFRFEKVPRVLLGWRERPDRFSRRSPCYSLNSFYRTKAMYLSMLPMFRERRVVFAGSGQTARRLSRWMIFEGFRIEAFLCADPGRDGDTLRGIPVVDSERIGEYKGVPVVAASREQGARQRIRSFLTDRGLVEGRDFVVCA